MQSAPLKLAGDLAAAISYYLCFGMPPVAAPTKHDKVYFGQPFEIVARPMIIFSAVGTRLFIDAHTP
ncbi:hypothetical protein EWM64_g24 [Hericium alpestre]|uniref:Uncharacterized protein n=1 Tax=Hericium alpestre TaxID=135208 RepID=A0A4Z0AA37_9AGAM|nr:hypothetical protein EWM64_g24 [Hericium alpestre]